MEYLWIAIPYLLYPFLNMLYTSLIPKYPWADVRLDILIHLPLIAIGLWKRSVPVTLFWGSTVVMQIAAMLRIAHGYYGTVQTAVWLVMMLGGIALLAYLLWQSRQEFLTVTFGLLPLILGFIGV